ncbi:MAG: hypothetical protein WA864_19975 [Acetobacteraceae bacterium]
MTASTGYLIKTSPHQVEAWSAWALPFVHLSTEQSCFREMLRDAIGCLDPCSGLRATYSTVQPRGPDLENLLFYNVGSHPFAKVGKDRIRFERLVESPLTMNDQLLHHVCYRIEGEGTLFLATNGTCLAESSADFPLTLVGNELIARLWKEFKKNLHVLGARSSSVGRFAAQIALKAPAERRLDTKMKRLLDAFLSALHSYSGNQLEDVVRRLASVLHETDQKLLRDLLCDPRLAILEPRRTPHLRAATLQWSPADDRLVAAEIIRVPAAANGPMSARARLFGLP